MIRSALIASLLTLPQNAGAEVPSTYDPLIAFLAPHGCAIGPVTKDSAGAAGFSEAELDGLQAAAALAGQAQVEGDWVVLGAETCTIAMPQIDSVLSYDDLEVQAAIGPVDEYASEGIYGCFLSGQKLREGLQDTRGWDRNRAFFGSFRFVGSEIAAGRIRFYGDSPLVTPPGFQVMTGACGDVPLAAKMRASFALFVEDFDPLVRLSAEMTPCAEGETPWLFDPKRLPNPNQTNAWIAFELLIVTMGTDWYAGVDATTNGTPRPPLCHMP